MEDFKMTALDDDRAVFKAAKKAAKQGNVEAQSFLGLMYSEGLGVAQDYKQAVYWYQKAADQGYAEAQNNLRRLRGR
jgi:TPR repeat protein